MEHCEEANWKQMGRKKKIEGNMNTIQYKNSNTLQIQTPTLVNGEHTFDCIFAYLILMHRSSCFRLKRTVCKILIFRFLKRRKKWATKEHTKPPWKVKGKKRSAMKSSEKSVHATRVENRSKRKHKGHLYFSGSA